MVGKNPQIPLVAKNTHHPEMMQGHKPWVAQSEQLNQGDQAPGEDIRHTTLARPVHGSRSRTTEDPWQQLYTLESYWCLVRYLEASVKVTPVDR